VSLRPIVPPFTSRRSPVLGRKGAICASQPLAAVAGLVGLGAGGCAADAAWAAARALGVVEPMWGGLGGDLFALVWDERQQRLSALNASGHSVSSASLEGLDAIALDSPHAVTVPGALRGFETLLAHYGRLGWARAFDGARRHAREGYPVSEKIAEGWRTLEPKLGKTPEAAQAFLVGGRAPRAGEIMRLPDLAATLDLLAAQGAGALYEGPIGEAVVRSMNARGARWSMDDLRREEATWDEAIHADYRGYRAFEHPPNGQGLAALMALRLLEGFDLRAMGALSADAFHVAIEAMKLAFVDAHRHVADPAFASVPVAELLSDDYMAERRRSIDPKRAAASVHPGVLPRGSDTVYLCAVDGEGNAVSLIHSLYYGFGSGLVAEGTGLALQNRGAGFSLDPAHPNALGPRKRPFHTIIPAMLFRTPGAPRGEVWAGGSPVTPPEGNGPLMPFGVMGGPMQPQGHLQVVTNLVDFGMDVQQVLDAPRFRVIEDGGARVMFEEGVPRAVVAELAARGHDVVPASDPGFGGFGGGQAIWLDPVSGVRACGSDSRKDGQAVVES
jgi:gamma-glutamyltranspeptidase/glutathione hydrolase